MRCLIRPAIGLAGLLALLAIAAAPTARASEMSADQRKAIEAVIEDYLVSNPEVIERALRALEAKRKADEARAAEIALTTFRKELFEDTAVPVGGNARGDVTVVEFFDYRCGVCKRVHPVVDELIKTDDKIRRVYKEWPILGPDSVLAARAALASRAQGKYIEFHDALMGHRGRLDEQDIMALAGRVGLDVGRLRKEMNSLEITEILTRNYAIADALKFNGTPSFLIGDQIVRGGRDLATMRRLVAQAREAAKE